MFPYMDSIAITARAVQALDIAQTDDIVHRVQALNPEQQRDLLFGLIGRMSVSNSDALMAEVELSEAEDV